VTGTNKGGLTLDIKGVRAFLPVSHVALERVEDLTPYLGRKLRCEVTSFNRSSQNLVVSRRPILEEEAETVRQKTLATLSEGQIVRGVVARITDHGAFVDIGGMQGLIAASRIRSHGKSSGSESAVREGQEILVQVLRVDREKGRVSLDFQQQEADSWGRVMEHYHVGDEVTGWVSGVTEAGVCVSVEEGIVGLIPADAVGLLEERPRPGAIVRTVITSVDPVERRMSLRPSRGARKRP